MKKSTIFIALLITSTQALAQSTGALSAARGANENFEQAYARTTGRNMAPAAFNIGAAAGGFFNFSPTPGTAYNSRAPLQQLAVNQVPELSSGDASTGFAYVRDLRFVQTKDPNFKRRITWLYPDDGCYARAELMSQLMQQQNYPAPAKIFAFGNLQLQMQLQAQTPNTPSGSIRWWYHTAIAYRVNGQVMVFDPSLETQGPITVQDWGSRIGMNNEEVNFSVCSAAAVNPESNCLNPNQISWTSAVQLDIPYMSPEWSRVQQLGHDPMQYLGAQPPWQ